MSDKKLAEIICAALLAIVSALRKKYDLPTYHGMTIVFDESLHTTFTPSPEYITQTPQS